MKKILVLGHKGMLGQVVKNYFTEHGYEVITTNVRFSEANLEEWSTFIKSYENCIIINCIGKIKQKTDDTFNLIWANTILPLQIANILLPNQHLIHPSTDCVFDGNSKNPYSIDSEPDAKDIYGWSKRLGEVALINHKQATIIRVSIIGPDSSVQPKGLLGWFLSQPSGAELKGFTNHWWNGITTLEWCKQVEVILGNVSMYKGKLVQFGTLQIYSKYDLLLLFQETYRTDYKIIPYRTEKSVYRCLKPNIISENLSTQLLSISQIVEKK